MIQPLAARPPRRPNADYRWTSAKALAFLEALAIGGSVSVAAATVGMSRQSAYRLRRRLGADFAAVWDEGLKLARRGCFAVSQGDSDAQDDTPLLGHRQPDQP